MADAGKIAPTYDGEWSSDKTYDFHTYVTHNDNCYIAKQPSTGVEPTEEDNAYWFLALKNVSASDIDNILNGTTAVGNALKLNGLTEEEFVKGMGEYFASGETILSWALNPNGVYHKSFAGGIVPSDAPFDGEGHVELLLVNSRYTVRCTKFLGNDVFLRDIFSGAWYNNWHKPNARDADTVDGYHASDFQNVNDTRNIGDLFSSVTTPTDIRAIMYMIPSGHYICNSVSHPNVILPFADGVGMQVEWERMKNPDTGMYYGTLTIRSMIHNIYSFTCSIFNNSQYAEWVDNYRFLPLDGSVPMSGVLTVPNRIDVNNGNDNTKKARVGHDSNYAYLINFDSANNKWRGISIDLSVDAKEGLKYLDVVNGVETYYTVLHTGNSQKVATSASAPSDTSAVWVDSANKVSKIYIDGAWTALA